MIIQPIPCACTLELEPDDLPPGLATPGSTAKAKVRCWGHLLPLSDYGRADSNMTFKAWGCSNKLCGFGLAIDNGDPGYIDTIPDRPSREERTRKRKGAAADG